jgi:putative ABC transport system permease protein
VLFSSTTITYGNDTLSTNVTGSTPDIQQILNLEIQEGSFFTETQQSARASVIVIGPRAAERLTGKSTGVVGTVLRINGHPFRVVGVTKPKGGNQFSSPDYMIYMPISSMQMRVKSSAGSEEVDYIIVQAQDSQSMTLAIQETREIMRSSHRLTPRQPDDFTITNQEDFLSIANSITQILTIMLSGIGGISLLVGGIGIMNMMLVTVTERTREIGLRKALGARKSDILLQFLTESAMLSLIGGMIGIAFGWGLSSLVGLIAANSGAPLAPVIGVSSILLATLFSAAVGVFFGWYPARRAANLQPVEALRYE